MLSVRRRLLADEEALLLTGVSEFVFSFLRFLFLYRWGIAESGIVYECEARIGLSSHDGTVEAPSTVNGARPLPPALVLSLPVALLEDRRPRLLRSSLPAPCRRGPVEPVLLLTTKLFRVDSAIVLRRSPVGGLLRGNTSPNPPSQEPWLATETSPLLLAVLRLPLAVLLPAPKIIAKGEIQHIEPR